MTPKLSAVLVGLLFVSSVAPRASAQTAAPMPPVEEPAPVVSGPEAVTVAPPPEKKKSGSGPGLSLSPETPQVGGRVDVARRAVAGRRGRAERRVEVRGHRLLPRADAHVVGPCGRRRRRTRWGSTIDSGTQLRTPPMVPDANYIDWRYTNSLVAPWTELNFKYGNDRVKAQVQIASYNLTDPGYRRLESNLGINQAFIQMLWPELGGSENWHLSLIVGGFTNRYGAAGRYDAGKYETYLFGAHARRGPDRQRGLRRQRRLDVPDRGWRRRQAGADPLLRRAGRRRRSAHATADVGAVPGPAADGVRVRAARRTSARCGRSS